jgi:predicted PurR-regulated permease PerM
MQSEFDNSSAAGAYAADWGPWTRKVTVVVLLIALAVVGILFQHALTYAVLGLILAYVLYFPIRLLARRTRLSYAPSVGLVFLVYLALVVLLLLAVAPLLVQDLIDLLGQIGTATEGLRQLGLDAASDQDKIDLDLGPLSNLVRIELTAKLIEAWAANLNARLDALVQGIVSLGTGIIWLLTIHVIALFALLELPKLFTGALDRLSGAPRREMAVLTGRMMTKWHRTFWATLLFGALVGGLNAVQMTLLGIPSALTVGLVTGLLALVPVIGPFINIFVIAGAALVQGSTTLPIDPVALALLTVAINLVIVVILAEVVFPKIVGQAVSLPVIVIIPAVIIAAAVAGPLGAVIVVPILGFASEIVQYLVNKVRGGDPYPGESEPVFFEGLL